MPMLCAIFGLVLILAALWMLQRLLYKKLRIPPNPEKNPSHNIAAKTPD